MIQKCPKCGMWCEALEESLTDRIVANYTDDTKSTKGIAKGIINATIDIIAFPTIPMAKTTKAIIQNKYKFICSRCGNKWSTDDSTKDQTNVVVSDATHLLKQLHENFNQIEEPATCYNYLQKLNCYTKINTLNSAFVQLFSEWPVEDELLAKYTQRFLDIPRSQRKYLILTQHLNYFPDAIKVLHIDKYPEGIVFSNGFPQEYTVYVCHPLRNNYYMPLSDAKFELFKDEVCEFMRLMVSLGAKRIYVEDLERETNAQSQKDALKGGVGGKYKGVGGSLEGALNSVEEQFKEFRREYSSDRICELGEELPHVPTDGLIWYKSRLGWQDIAQSRCNNGKDLTCSVRISTKEQGLISQSEMQQLSVELNHLVASGNAHGKYEIGQSFFSEKEHTWSVKVEFYSLSAYKKSGLNSIVDKLGSIFTNK